MSSHAATPAVIARPRREAPRQVTRTGQAAILTGITLALVVAIGLTFGAMGVALVVVTLPVPLLLLWLSADVFRADEIEK
jgi:hypothetical protein